MAIRLLKTIIHAGKEISPEDTLPEFTALEEDVLVSAGAAELVKVSQARAPIVENIDVKTGKAGK